MKKERSAFQFQVMYVHHYILSNTKNLNYHRTHHTPVHNPFMEITIICYHKKHQLKNWMNIIRKYLRNL